jgi:hypothetical protein
MKLKRLLLTLLIITNSNAQTTKPDQSSDNLEEYWAWLRGTAQAAPNQDSTYKIPTLHDSGQHYNDTPEPLVKAPNINADALFQRVLACYPIPSNFNLEVRLKGAVGWKPESNTSTTELGNNYVQIVAEMPLYSTSDLDRATDREYRRRDATAGVIADFVASIAKRNHAIRELALFRSLEARSRARVQAGIVDASEQVGYLTKVANAQESLITAETKILDARLKLASMCRPELASSITNWLSDISKVPQFDN